MATDRNSAPRSIKGNTMTQILIVMFLALNSHGHVIAMEVKEFPTHNCYEDGKVMEKKFTRSIVNGKKSKVGRILAESHCLDIIVK